MIFFLRRHVALKKRRHLSQSDEDDSNTVSNCERVGAPELDQSKRDAEIRGKEFSCKSPFERNVCWQSNDISARPIFIPAHDVVDSEEEPSEELYDVEDHVSNSSICIEVPELERLEPGQLFRDPNTRAQEKIARHDIGNWRDDIRKDIQSGIDKMCSIHMQILEQYAMKSAPEEIKDEYYRAISRTAVQRAEVEAKVIELESKRAELELKKIELESMQLSEKKAVVSDTNSSDCIIKSRKDVSPLSSVDTHVIELESKQAELELEKIELQSIQFIDERGVVSDSNSSDCVIKSRDDISPLSSVEAHMIELESKPKQAELDIREIGLEAIQFSDGKAMVSDSNSSDCIIKSREGFSSFSSIGADEDSVEL
jgi:hypothetical protein